MPNITSEQQHFEWPLVSIVISDTLEITVPTAFSSLRFPLRMRFHHDAMLSNNSLQQGHPPDMESSQPGP
jgi:hypothetical protein